MNNVTATTRTGHAGPARNAGPVRHVRPVPDQPAPGQDKPQKFSPWALIDAMSDADVDPRDLAIAIGCSLDVIGRWMAGVAAPKTGNARQAARALGVPVEDLYEDA